MQPYGPQKLCPKLSLYLGKRARFLPRNLCLIFLEKRAQSVLENRAETVLYDCNKWGRTSPRFQCTINAGRTFTLKLEPAVNDLGFRATENHSQLSLGIRALALLQLSPAKMCFSHFSPSSSLGNRATQEFSLEWMPKRNLMYFIYPIRVILMTFHLQRTRLDLSQEIYGWDLIFRSLKSPKWTLHEIFLIEKSHHPKY